MKLKKVLKAAQLRGMYFNPDTGYSRYYTVLTNDGYRYCETLRDVYRLITKHKKVDYSRPFERKQKSPAYAATYTRQRH